VYRSVENEKMEVEDGNDVVVEIEEQLAGLVLDPETEDPCLTLEQATELIGAKLGEVSSALAESGRVLFTDNIGIGVDWGIGCHVNDKLFQSGVQAAADKIYEETCIFFRQQMRLYENSEVGSLRIMPVPNPENGTIHFGLCFCLRGMNNLGKAHEATPEGAPIDAGY
jgi:hypothetical protein